MLFNCAVLAIIKNRSTRAHFFSSVFPLSPVSLRYRYVDAGSIGAKIQTLFFIEVPFPLMLPVHAFGPSRVPLFDGQPHTA